MAIGKRNPLLVFMYFALLWRTQAMRLQNQKNAADTDNNATWCWFSGSDELKKYYFEFAFNPQDPDEHTAITLVRDSERPKLQVYHKSKWVVRTPPKDKESDSNADLPWIPDVEAPDEMEWLAACMQDHGQCNEHEHQEIDLMNVYYIRKVLIPVVDPDTEQPKEGEEEIGIEIVFNDGRKEQFEGGVYMPRNLMLPAMQRAEEENFKHSGQAADAKEWASSSDNMFNQAIYTFRDSVTGTISTASKTGAGAGVSVGLGIGGVALLLALPGLKGFILAVMVAGAGLGAVAGAGAGLVLGGVIGMISGGTMSLMDYHKQKVELGLSATEKMWDKLECHGKFSHCNSTVIVPQGKACPGA